MKLLKSATLFLFIFFAGQWFISISLDAIISKSSFRFSMLYFKSNKMDNEILCIGNSRGINSFYTPGINEKYAVKSFNLSYNGLKMALVKVFLDDYLDNHHYPKKVFIEVSNVFNSDSFTNFSEFNLYSSKSKKLNKAIKETSMNTHLISSIFPIYRYNSELLYRSIYYLDKPDQDWINRYTISEELNNEVLGMMPENFEINKSDLIILQKIVDKLKNDNIEVCLFVAPYLPNYLAKINNLSDQIKFMEKATGITVIDLSGLLTKPEYFADRIHTNEKGAILIADKLMKSTSITFNK